MVWLGNEKRGFKPNDPNQQITNHALYNSRGSTHYSYHTAVGDLNGDGANDLFVCGFSSTGGNLVYTGDGKGGFAHVCRDTGRPAWWTLQYGQECDSQNIFGSFNHALILDLNADGHADIFGVADGTGYFLGDGDMGFTQVQSGDAVLPQCGAHPTPGHTAAADLNGDSHIDLYVSCGAGVESRLLLGDGQGVFTAQAGPAASGPAAGQAMHTSIGHLNGDAHADLFVCMYGDSSDVKSQIYYGGGDGTFTAEADDSWQSSYNGGCASCLADLTGDGNLDIYVAHHSAPNELYAGDGSGGFARTYTDDTRHDHPLTSWDTHSAKQAICEDLDGDQHLDVYMSCEGLGTDNMLFHGDGAGNSYI